MTDKMSDPASGNLRKVEDDPWAELFAECENVEDVMELQAEIVAMETRREPGE